MHRNAVCPDRISFRKWRVLACQMVLLCFGVTACALSPNAVSPAMQGTPISPITTGAQPPVDGGVLPARATAAQCAPAPAPPDDTPLALPDLAALEWEGVEIGGERVRQLTGLTLEPTAFTLARAGSTLAVALQPPRSTRAAIAVIEEGSGHWWVKRDSHLNVAEPPLPLLAWLPSGEAVWVNEAGAVRVGAGESARSLNAPIAAAELLAVADSTLFVRNSETNALWRLDIAEQNGEEVTTNDGGAVIAFANSAQLANAGEYLFVMGDEQLWKVPAEMGAAAEVVALEPYEVVGSGQAYPPPQQLGDSPYWLISLPIQPVAPLEIEGRALIQGGMVLDERDGTQLRAAAMGIPAPYDAIFSITLSADGAWLAVTALSRADVAAGRWQPAVYVARAGEWEGGFLIEGVEAAGLLAEPPTLAARNIANDAMALYPLTENGAAQKHTLANAEELLAVGGGRIYTRGVGDPMRILAFDAQGQQVGALALGGVYAGFGRVTASAEGLLVSARYADEAGGCVYAVVWEAAGG